MSLLCSTIVFTVLFVTQFNPVRNSNILAFLPAQGRSHVMPFHPFFRELANRGHNITTFSYFPIKMPAPHTDIVIEANIQIFDIGMANLRTYSRLFNWKYLHDELQIYLGELVREKQFQGFLHSSDTKFDLIFVELYHLDASLALGQRFNCPIIGLSAQPMLTIYQWLLGNPTTFSYIPHSYLPYTDSMTFWQRSVNSFFGVFTALYYNFVSIPKYQKTVDFILGQTKQRIPSIQELTRNLSLVLVESHFSSAHVRPNVPNVIDVAGIHIENVKALPKDIQTFMDEAEHGVIYVSLGTLINPELAGELGIKLSNIFRKLPQRVIWKWNPNTIGDVSENLMVRNWLPQNDILNHSNCRLFISHGGYHSILETIYSGTPILGLPFFTDQYYNMALIEKLNIGKKIDPDSSERKILQTIHELLEDDTYRQRCQKQSTIFKDRPASPMNTAIYWTEYVLRHGGAHHLKTSAVDLYWYEYLLLDLMFIPALALGLMYVIVIILRKLRNALLLVKAKDSLKSENKKIN